MQHNNTYLYYIKGVVECPTNSRTIDALKARGWCQQRTHPCASPAKTPEKGCQTD